MEKLKFMILLSLSISTFFLGELQADYGDSCTIYKPCTTSNILDPVRCGSDQMESVCICDFHMFRHIELNRCVSPHNMTCTVHANDGLPSRTCTEFADCVPRALNESDPLRQNGTCLCHDDAKYDPVSQQCKLTHGSARCRKETDCDVLSSLTCRQDKCVCQDEMFQKFDSKDGKCKSLLGGSCVADPPFVAPVCFGVNMKCDDEGVSATNKCICDSGFVTDPENDKMCVGTYGADCDNETSPCNKDNFLMCSDNTCKCQDKYEYDNETGVCKGFLAQQCRADQDCVGNLACIPTGGNPSCGCSARYEPSSDMECVGLYGAPCSSGFGCSSSRLLSCNPSSNRCDCHDPLRHIYEKERDACMGKANMECSGAVNGTKCVTDATCVGSPPIPTCQCRLGHEATKEGRCVRLNADESYEDDSSAKTVRGSLSLSTCILIILERFQ